MSTFAGRLGVGGLRFLLCGLQRAVGFCDNSVSFGRVGWRVTDLDHAFARRSLQLLGDGAVHGTGSDATSVFSNRGAFGSANPYGEQATAGACLSLYEKFVPSKVPQKHVYGVLATVGPTFEYEHKEMALDHCHEQRKVALNVLTDLVIEAFKALSILGFPDFIDPVIP